MIAIPAGNLTQMIGEYLTEKTGIEFKPNSFQAMMVVNDNQDFVAGVVFNNFRNIDVEVSCAGESATAWRPHVCRAVFKYVFDQLGCTRCTSITTKGNKRARAFLEGLGFVLEGNIRLGYDGRRDALVYGLLRSECRFLIEGGIERDGQKFEQPANRAGPDSDGEHPSGLQHVGGREPSEPEPDQSGNAPGLDFVFADGNQF